MQGALMSARCCDALVFANAEAGEGNTVPSAPFQPGKPQEWRSYAECRQAACVNLLESAHFCVSDETHRTLLQEASMTTEYESQFVNTPAQEVNAFERGESLRIGVESVIVDPAVPTEARKEACELDVAGKYEPQLRENGIPADVLEKLLPGDDVVELAKPTIAGGLGYRFVKRAFDVCSTGCALIILAIPMGIIALRIKSESPGPVIYAQERVGKNGKPFMVYKFRSMYVDAEKRGAQWAQGDDPRVTPFGKVMRKTRLDEIPQFWNVFKGDMSLIGPRPERPAFCAEFEKRIHGWHYRTMVTPGLSGLAQVTGGYDLLPKEKVVLDLGYIEHRSIAMDLKIILKTLGVVSTGEGAR